jgi:RimJ/RimL family protein N-acetyltransferase
MIVPVLETQRLILRGVRPDDFEAFAAFFATDAAQFVGGPRDRAGAWRALATIAGSWTLRGFGEFSVEEKATGRLAGIVGPWFPEGWPEKEIGWIILPEFQGRGFAPEAAARALEFAYADLGWTTAISCIDDRNAPSIAVARKLGAVREGLVEFVPYGMLPLYRHQSPAQFLARVSGEAA